MSLRVLVSVSLDEGTTPSQLEQFEVGMRTRRWTRITEGVAAWETAFQVATGIGPALSMTESDVAAAARAAGIIRYKAVANAGGMETLEFEA